MKSPTRNRPIAAVIAALLAAQAVFLHTSQAQVTFTQVTNGLVDYYPLDSLTPGNATTTPDLISRRDMTLVNMTSANIISDTHAGINSSNLVFNFNQAGGKPTLIYYHTTGQNPLDGSGDFLPFINQRGATMNFWVKANQVNPGSELRVMAECANDGDAQPFFSWSAKSSDNNQANLFFRDDAAGQATDPNGVACQQLDDGTYQLPCVGYYYNQGSQNTTNTVLDGNWHMFTTTIDTNGDFHVFVDGSYDPGTQSGGPYTDLEGNPAIGPSLPTTNYYYSTNIYPSLGVSNPPPNGFVRWMSKMNATADTTFGGFIRNAAQSGGLQEEISDIGYWNRALSPSEIQFVMTNGLNGLTLNTNTMLVQAFYSDFGEIGVGNTVNLHWQVLGATNVSISGIGNNLGNSGQTNITLPNNQTYTFTLTAANGVVANIDQSISILTIKSVPSDWNLIQRFDGLFSPTTQGFNGNQWTTLQGIYSGALDRFNVVKVNGNEVISPKSGYFAASDALNFDSRGALSYGQLNGLTIPPNQENTLFFRFSSTDPGTFASQGIYSGLDFTAGITDFGFATGPIGGTTPVPGQGGAVGPGIHIIRADPSGNFGPGMPFDLTADDYDGSSVTNSYSYTNSVDANGLQTNVNYMLWLDVSNENTAENISGGTTNTINEPVFSAWLQKEGDPSPTLLFSGFHGDRDYSQSGINSDFPTPYLDKVYASVGTGSFESDVPGAFFETNNMIVLDDFYLSKNGPDITIPRLFDLTAIVRGATNATIQWASLGSLFQTNTYSVQRTFTLNNPNWVTLTNGMPSGGDFTSFTDNTLGSANQAFYRISWP